MQLGDLTFSQRDYPDTGKLQVLVEGCNIRLIAADPIQHLGDHDIELPALRVTHQLLDARTKDGA